VSSDGSEPASPGIADNKTSSDEVNRAGESNKPGDEANSAGESNKANGKADNAPEEKTLDSIGAMYAALRACWVPPPKKAARHRMEYTIRFAVKRDGEMLAPPRVTYSSHDAPAGVRDLYRDAVNAALARCMPLHFGAGMAGAVAGRPIAIRLVDKRSTEKSLQ